MNTLRSLLLRSALVPLAAAPLLAGTWIVDDDGGPGVDFTDIQPAITAALPGDVIRVFPGAYSGFTLDRALVLVGAGNGTRSVLGPILVGGIGAGSFTVLADLHAAQDLDLSGCAGVVVVDSLSSTGRVQVQACADARIANAVVTAPDGATSGAGGEHALLSSGGSRVEIVACELTGGDGAPTYGSAPGPGGAGILQQAFSGELRVYRSQLVGGNGGDQSDPFNYVVPSGNGGSGVSNGNLCAIAGEAFHVAVGGWPGWGNQMGGFGSGYHGTVVSSSARISGATVAGASGPGSVQTPSPADPTLFALGVPQGGQVTTFRVTAPAGSIVDLNLGRFPDLVPVGGLEEDILIKTVRTFSLGAVGGSGVVGLNFTVPGSLTPGFAFFAQARVTLPGGGTRYTNSVPVVLR